jgi:WD40 repeat protein
LCQTFELRAAAFAPDGKRVLAADNDHSLRLFDVADGKEIGRFFGHNAFVQSVAFSPDGTRILSAAGADAGAGQPSDCTLRLWDVTHAKELHCFRGHTRPVWLAAYNQDGSLPASASYDHTVRIWRLPH